MLDETREQLEATAEAHGETRSALTQRYIDEGLRMDRATPVSCSGPARQDADQDWPEAPTFGRWSESFGTWRRAVTGPSRKRRVGSASRPPRFGSPWSTTRTTRPRSMPGWRRSTPRRSRRRSFSGTGRKCFVEAARRRCAGRGVLPRVSFRGPVARSGWHFEEHFSTNWALPVPQGFGRIDLRGACAGDGSRDERDAEEDHGRRREGHRVTG
jgi:hypothetical protein